MKPFLAASLAICLSGCVSTGMNSLIDHPIQDAQVKYGAPSQVIDMPDGSRIYQFPYGGGLVGGSGGVGVVSGPCRLGFVTRQRAGIWVIEKTQVPRELAC